MKFLSKPEMPSILKAFEYTIRGNLKCASIGKVQRVDTENGTVDVKLVIRPNLTKVGEKGAKFFDDNGEHTTPVLKNVPILVSHCTKPLYYNDNVLLVFNDFDFDDWYNSDDYMKDLGDTKHSINNAIAIPGIDNAINSTFIPPEGYSAPNLPASIFESPFPKYGFDNENACLHWANGEVRAGAWGVTITSRDGSDVNVFSENGSVNFYPTVDFHVNTGKCHFIVNSYTTVGALKGLDNSSLKDKEHRITMYTTAVSKLITKKNAEEMKELEGMGLEVGDKVFTSDLYRILRLVRAMLKEVALCFGQTATDGSMGALLASDDEVHAGGRALAAGGKLLGMVNDLGDRIDGLLAPADPIKEE